MVGKLFFTMSGRPYDVQWLGRRGGEPERGLDRRALRRRPREVPRQLDLRARATGTAQRRTAGGSRAPAGRASALSRWVDERDGRYDLAAVVVATDGDEAVADRVGALPIVFDQMPESGQPVRILGYPGRAPFDGSDLEQCTGQVAERDEPPYINGPADDGSSTAAEPSEPSGYRVGCDLTPGSSGGPLLLGPPDDGTGGSVFSVVSSGPVTAVTGAYQGELARALWERAQTFE